MAPSFLIGLILTQLSLAGPEAERVAMLDAEQSFVEFERSVADLITKPLESPVEFESLRWPVENGFKKYCESMKKYPAIHVKCPALEKSAKERLDKRQDFLKKTVKEDKYAAALGQIDSFYARSSQLRSVQPDGKNIAPDVLNQQRMTLEQEMAAYCPKAPRPELKKSCLAELERMRIQLANYEHDLRSGAFVDPPPSKKKYTATDPYFRCFPHLPKLRDKNLSYKISDGEGRYRYEHLVLTRWGYAINVKLSDFIKNGVNDSLTLQKKFTDPRNNKSYSAFISPSFSCAPDGKNPPNCKPFAISVTLWHEAGDTKVAEARGRFFFAHDSELELVLPLDQNGAEEFRLSCAIVANMRKGGWIYSDEFFEEK